MPPTNMTPEELNAALDACEAQLNAIPLEYAGQWIAWSPDGLKIIAVEQTFAECEATAVRAGYRPWNVVIERVPETRDSEPRPER
jgi:hypothetical protein